MSIRKAAAEVRREVVRAIDQRPRRLHCDGPLVSFTFDDFPRTALSVGGEILKSYGARGTYYTSMGLMGSTTELGELFRRNDLDVLLADGHELANHTFSHVSCRAMSPERFLEEVQRGQVAIDSLLSEQSRRNFSFPFGDITMRAKHSVGRHVSSSRGIWGGLNDMTADLNLLLANCLYGGDESKPRMRELIEENHRRNGWLIFYTHDVQLTPSRFGCTPDILEYAVSLAARLGTIRTVADVIAASSEPRHEAAVNNL